MTKVSHAGRDRITRYTILIDTRTCSLNIELTKRLMMQIKASVNSTLAVVRNRYTVLTARWDHVKTLMYCICVGMHYKAASHFRHLFTYAYYKINTDKSTVWLRNFHFIFMLQLNSATVLSTSLSNPWQPIKGLLDLHEILFSSSTLQFCVCSNFIGVMKFH